MSHWGPVNDQVIEADGSRVVKIEDADGARLPVGGGSVIELIVFLVVLALIVLTLARTIRVPQARAGVVERFGRSSRAR